MLVKKKITDFHESQSFIAYFSTSSFLLMFVISFLDSQPFISRWLPILFILAICIFLKFGSIILKGLYGKIAIYLLVIIMTYYFAVDTFDFLGSVIFERFDDLSSTDSRMNLLSAARDQFLSAPILGAGATLPDGGFSHNILVEAFLTTGVVGGLLFLFVNFAATIKTLYLICVDSKNAWIGYLFINYLIAALFSGALHLVLQYWILLSIVLSLSNRMKAKHAISFKLNTA